MTHICVGVLVGGTSVVFNILELSGERLCQQKFSWEDVKSALVNMRLEVNPFSFVNFLAARISDLLKQSMISPENVISISISSAGVFKNGLLNASNLPIGMANFPFRAEISKQLAQHGFVLEMIRLVTFNDGFSGALGEFRSGGGRLRQGRGIFVVWGTGIGGGGIDHGEVKPEISEIGHCLLRTTERSAGGLPVYVWCSLDELAQRGYLVNMQLRPTGPSFQFFEKRAGGTWVAVRFAKACYARGLGEELLARVRKGQSGLTSEQLEASFSLLLALQEDGENSWNHHANARLVKNLNEIIAKGHSTAQPSALDQFAREYELDIYREWGAALRTLRDQFPGYPVVLGSMLAEIRRHDAIFIETLRSISGYEADELSVSNLEAAEREVAAFL